MEKALSAFKGLKTINGMNTAKITGILMLFIGLFIYFQGTEIGDSFYVLGLVSAILGGIWILYAAALALSVVKDKGGILGFYRWEMTQLKDYLLSLSIKMVWQILAILGVFFLFFAEKYENLEKAMRDRIRTLGYTAIGFSAIYFLVNVVIGLKMIS